MSSKRSQVMSIVGLLAIAFTVCCVQAEDARYIPIKGNAWRLALADINGDGKKELIYGSFDGAVRCIDPHDGGMLLWELPLDGAFVWSLTCKDIKGDGKAEVFAAVSDGFVYVSDPTGRCCGSTRRPCRSGALVCQRGRVSRSRNAGHCAASPRGENGSDQGVESNGPNNSGSSP